MQDLVESAIEVNEQIAREETLDKSEVAAAAEEQHQLPKEASTAAVEVELEISASSTQEEKITEKEPQENACVKSPLDFSDLVLLSIAERFRELIPRRTVMAFGVKHAQVFTGEQIYETLKQCLNWLESENNHMSLELDSFLYSSSQLELLASRLVHELMLFIPCSLQQRKCIQKSNESLKSSAASKKSSELSRKNTIRRKKILICDDDHTLYCLCKDALLQETITADFYKDFVQWMKDGNRGVALKEGKVLFKTITRADRVFSKKAMIAWLLVNAGIEDSQELESVWKLLKRRKVFKSIAFSSYYQFV